MLTEELYEQIQNLLNNNSYDLAIQNLQLLESRFPFGSYADPQLDIIYAYYQNNDEGATIAAAERFIPHHDHPDVDYAWYMKGLANYSLKPGLLTRFYQATKLPKMLNLRGIRLKSLVIFISLPKKYLCKRCISKNGIYKKYFG